MYLATPHLTLEWRASVLRCSVGIHQDLVDASGVSCKTLAQYIEGQYCLSCEEQLLNLRQLVHDAVEARHHFTLNPSYPVKSGPDQKDDLADITKE